MLKRLQQSGLVSRTRSAKNERQVLIRLTEERLPHIVQQKARVIIPETYGVQRNVIEYLRVRIEYLRVRLIENL
ncbi:MAG: transcriptional regulator, SarA/Rot family [Symbiopectobacterium sp.]